MFCLKTSCSRAQYLRQICLPLGIPMAIGSSHHCVHYTKRPINPESVRLGFIPDKWFEFFYAKTGKTGPYVFGLGLLNFLFSKEIYVCEHEFFNGISMVILCVVAVKKLGPKTATYCDREIDKFENNWKKKNEEELQDLRDLIEREKLEQWRAEGSLMLMQEKKENISLQLEAAYRKALWKVYEDVKRRLDYQVVCRNTEERMNRKHMMSWVVQNVIEELPQIKDKTLFEKYKKDLSAKALGI